MGSSKGYNLADKLRGAIIHLHLLTLSSHPRCATSFAHLLFIRVEYTSSNLDGLLVVYVSQVLVVITVRPQHHLPQFPSLQGRVSYLGKLAYRQQVNSQYCLRAVHSLILPAWCSFLITFNISATGELHISSICRHLTHKLAANSSKMSGLSGLRLSADIAVPSHL